MIWEFQATVSDDIHRLVDRQGNITWGVEHDGFDVDHPEALGTAEVGMPTGTAELLLVPPSPGGLVLDVVRSYQGLTEGELCTLFLGVIDELRTVAEAQSRLCLQAIGLAADGRPRIVPGISQPPLSSHRRAIGEMLYHASHGRPWAESLLPVNIALEGSSAALRSLVAELLDETVPAGSLAETFVEVAEALRGMSAPSALPLLPAERDLDPGQALTARLRAANGHAPARAPLATIGHSSAAGLPADAGIPAGSGLPVTTERASGCGSPATDSTSTRVRGGDGQVGDSAERLRAASRNGATRLRRAQGPRRGRTGSRGVRHGTLSLLAILEWLRTRSAVIPVRLNRGRLLSVIIAVCLTLVGGAVLVQSWQGDETPTSARPSAEAEDARSAGGVSAEDDPILTDDRVLEVLEELCERRAAALSGGDGDALNALTVPGSSAALADELIDVAAYAGMDYDIELSKVEVVDKTAEVVRATATMTSTARSGRQVGFEPTRVEFELSLDDAVWKVSAVRELADQNER